MRRFSRLKKWTTLVVTLAMVMSIFLPSIAHAEGTDSVTIQVLATSDLHGKFLPYDYATNSESKSGSIAQIAAYVKQARKENPNTVLVDNGDNIQGNSSQIFLNDDIHPMILAMNEMGYDSFTLGNHEFNYGIKALDKVLSQLKAPVLAGNVYKPDGTRYAAPYTIVEKGGVKIGIIGMTNPNITKWDASKLTGYSAKSPVEEAKAAAAELKDKVDVMIGVIHVGETQEHFNEDGADVIAAAVPELAVIIAGHAHKAVEAKRYNGVLVTEPLNNGAAVSKIDIKLTKDSSGKYVIADRTADVSSKLVYIQDSKTKAVNYEADPDLVTKLEAYHQRAIKDGGIVIGKLEGGDLVPPAEVKGIPASQVLDTAMIDLINEVQLYYTGADVAAAAAFSTTANIKQGDITKAGVSQIYMYDNTLYKVQVTGKQLKQYMEWSAKYYNTYHEGDLTVSFNPNIRAYNYDMFSGVKYQVDISKEPGNRIVNLTKMDGTPIKDEDVLTLAVNNYRSDTQLSTPGAIYKAGETPTVLEKDVRGDIGGVRELIKEYIMTVKGGVIKPATDNNWSITGNSWDSKQRATAVRMINEDKIVIPQSADGRTPNVKSVTWEDILAVPDKTINILSFNDFHGSLKPDGKNVGAAKLAGEIKRIRYANPDTIVVSAGDIYQGSALSNLTTGKPVSEFLKAIYLEASAVGNHEFDWGVDKIGPWAKEGGFDFLASNIYAKATGKPVDWAKPYRVVTVHGVRIGLIGLSTPETAFKTKPENVKDIEFRDPAQSAEYWGEYLKSQNMADYVIALTHLGSEEKNGEIIGEAADLARKVKNVDAIISAHTHKKVSGYVNNIPIVQALYNGRVLAKLEIGFNVQGKFVGIKPYADELFVKTDLVEEPKVKAIYDKWVKELGPILDEVVGTTDKELPHDRFAGLSLLGEWSCDVMRKAAGTQIAITNGGGLRVPIPAGEITMGKLYEVMPFDNTLVKMQLKGSDLKMNIEHGINNTTYGWIQLSGIKVYYDPAKPAGDRITSMRLLDGTKVEMDKYYSVVTNDFMATGGDEYNFKGAIDMVDTGLPIRDALVNELKEVKNLSVEYVDYLIPGPDPVLSSVFILLPFAA